MVAEQWLRYGYCFNIFNTFTTAHYVAVEGYACVIEHLKVSEYINIGLYYSGIVYTYFKHHTGEINTPAAQPEQGLTVREVPQQAEVIIVRASINMVEAHEAVPALPEYSAIPREQLTRYC